MAGESTQDKLRRVRPPRVRIKYEVDIDGAQEVRELPFVIGVMGDFSGEPTEELPDLDDRGFVNIDRDTFDDVMSKMHAGTGEITVKNHLGDGEDELSVNLAFEKLDDFAPANVASQIPVLQELLDIRAKLTDLSIDVDRKKDLKKLLDQILSDPAKQEQLRGELEGGSAAAASGPPSTGSDPATDSSDDSPESNDGSEG